SVGSSSVLIKFTRGADADLDGIVGNSDVTIVGGKFGAAGSGGWYSGDFDYSGTCDNADVTALGGLFNPSAAPLAPATQTPSPMTCARTALKASAMTLIPPEALDVLRLAGVYDCKRQPEWLNSRIEIGYGKGV